MPDVIGRYEIRRAIGGGGMGVLYLARDPAIDRLVAIKLLRDGLDSLDLRRRFAREARSAGKLHHPNIVTIYDVGEHNGQPFIAMEYIVGQTLAEVIRRRTSTSLIRKLGWMEDLCGGLHYAHRAGVIHRDIKPANVMVSDEGVVKLLDFGIARIGATGITQGVIGTLNYMAPEQMEGKPLDARADIFSLGALFYELLAYAPAFPGGVSDGVLSKILSKAPEPLDEIVRFLDPQLISIVNRCLQKDPSDRYPDCAMLKRDLGTVRLRLLGVGETGAEPVPRWADETARIESPKPDTSKRGRQRIELLRIRTEQIRTHLAAAHTAMESGSYNEAVRECERALVLDPEQAEAGTLLDEARLALEREQIEQWVAEGQDQLARGAVTAASLLVDRALSLNSSSPEALALREAVDAARREFAEAQARVRRIEEILTSAEAELDAGSFDRAEFLVHEGLAIDPAYERTIDLKTRLDAAIAARRVAVEDARALEAVTAARRVFASGDRSSAMAELRRFRPEHQRVTAALAELEIEAREIARRADLKQQAARRQSEAETVRFEHQSPAPTVVAKRPRERRWALVAAAAGLAAVIGAGIWRVTPRTSPEAPSSVIVAPPPPPQPRSVDPLVPSRPDPTPPVAVVKPVEKPESPKPVAVPDNAAKTKGLADARAALSGKRYALAVEAYQKLARQFPNDSAVRAGLTEARTINAQQAGKAGDLQARGDNALQKRDYDAAIRLYEAAADEYPEQPDVAARVNDAKAAKARAEAALAEILRGRSGPSKPATGLSDDQRAKMLAQADALIDARLLDAAIAIFDQILAAEPDNTAAKLGKTKALALKPKR